MVFLWGPSLMAEIEYRQAKLIRAGGGSRRRRRARVAAQRAAHDTAPTRSAARPRTA